MKDLPPLRSVQAFEAVGRRGSVVSAAEELGVSSGAVSQQIRQLEEALDTRLFERRGRSLALTAWGVLYFERVRIAFEQLRAGQDDIRRARSKAGIVLSGLPSLALRWLSPLLLDWRAANEGVSTRLIGTDDECVFDRDHIDFRLSYGPASRDYDHFVILFTDSVVPVCSPEHLRKWPVTCPEDILSVPRIDIEWDYRYRPPPSWSDFAALVGVAGPTNADLAFSLSSAAIDAAINHGGFVLGQIGMVAEASDEVALAVE